MMKNKNPLYVITKKGSVVEEATNFVDALIKKLNLGPVIDFLQQIINMLLAQIKDYPTLVAVQEMIDLLLAKVQLFLKFSLV